MKTNFILLFLFLISSTAYLNAQTQKPWPYLKGIESYNKSDSTGKYLIKINGRNTKIFNKYGKVINNISEQNKSSDPFGKLDTTTLDTLKYDTKNRLLEKKSYALINGFISDISIESNQYFDSINKSSYTRQIYRNSNLQSENWNTLYKGKNELDSLIINGNGTIINNKYTSRIRYFYTNKRIDSSYYDTYDAANQIWQPLSKNNYSYLPGDTVLNTSYSYSSKKSSVSKRVYDIEGKLLFEEYGSYRTYYLLYNKNGQLMERKTFLFDANAKKYLIAAHILSNYDSNGAIAYILLKSYSSGIFTDANRIHYSYTLRPADPPKPPKKDSLAAIYDPNPPIDSIKEDTVTSSINNGFSQTTFNIFPNPAQNEILIAIPNAQKSEIKLYSMDGRLVFSKQIQINQQHINLDISALKAGMYILSLQGTDGQIQNKVLLKQ